MAARQRRKVQGRITNGTLFPNISMAIKRDTEATATATFEKLKNTLESTIVLLEDDIAMALTTMPHQSADMEEIDHEAEVKRREDLARAVQILRRKHTEVIRSIACI